MLQNMISPLAQWSRLLKGTCLIYQFTHLQYQMRLGLQRRSRFSIRTSKYLIQANGQNLLLQINMEGCLLQITYWDLSQY
jgi:hypothetical protein